MSDALAAERVTVLAQADALRRDLTEVDAATAWVATDDEHDPEGATVAFERARLSALLDHTLDQLLAIQAAEQRVAAGTYGQCERCGRPIGSERLVARPTAPTCVACASAQ